jgi:hypothetical protein
MFTVFITAFIHSGNMGWGNALNSTASGHDETWMEGECEFTAKYLFHISSVIVGRIGAKDLRRTERHVLSTVSADIVGVLLSS